MEQSSTVVIFEHELPTPGGLRRGPGRAIRWCAAVPLLLIAFVGAPLLVLAELEWASYLAVDKLYGAATWVPDAGELLVLGQVLGVLYTVILVLLIILRHSPRTWPKLALIATVPISLGTLVTYDDFPSENPPSAFERFVVGTPFLTGAVAIAIGLAASYAAARILTSPLALDVVNGKLDLTIRLRGKGRLRIRHDRLMLDKLRFPGGAPRQGPPKYSTRVTQLGIDLRDVHKVETGQFDSATEYAHPNGATQPLSPGPGLRVVGTHQQWLLPLDDPEAVSAAINRRIAAAPAARSMWVAGAYAYMLIGIIGVAGAIVAVVTTFTQAKPSYLLGALFYAAIGFGGLAAYSKSARKIRKMQDEPAGGHHGRLDDPPPTWHATV